MNLETIIADKVHNLPPVKQLRILTFIEELAIEKTSDDQFSNGQNALNDNKSNRYSFVGIGESANDDVSENAEEILASEIKRRSGWSLKSASM